MSDSINALKGVIITLISSVLIAILFAYFFRLPIPMSGYIGPFGEFSTYKLSVVDALKMVLSAWVLYGILGGFIILSLCGSITGILVGRKHSKSRIKNKMIMVWSIIVSTAPVFVLSILDYIIGPW